jgi:ribosomal protein S18 acetylase RimI-like enzyme
MMAVTRPRRLVVPTSLSLHDRLSRETLSCTYTRREIDGVERAHPDLVIECDGNLLTAIDHTTAAPLAYAFTSPRAFTDHFADMFEKLLPRVRKAYGPEHIRFRLMYGPARPAVEPVLRRLWFEPRKAWVQFSLAKGSSTAKPSTPRGIAFRHGSVADLDELLEIDHDAFPSTPITREGLRRLIEAEGRLLVAEQRGRAVGFALFDHDDPAAGYLRTLAVREEARDGGVGSALTLRVAKLLFAEGATRLDLRTDDDNAGAIRLYKRLGFKHVGAGRDYERPADPKTIARIRKEHEGTFIKFGGWR